MREFEPDSIRKALRELGMAEGRIFDRSQLESAQQEIKRQYLSKGMYAAEVQVTVTPLERNRVGINISVTEGEVAKIRGVNIVGANAFPEKDLLDEMILRTPGWLTWYTKADRYSREKARRRPGDAAQLLPEPRLPRFQRGVDPGFPSRPTGRTSTLPSTSRKAEKYTVLGRTAWRSDAGAEGGAAEARRAQARRCLQPRESW